MKRTELQRRSPLKRTGGPARKQMKRSQPKRDWTDARAKVDAEGKCRRCGLGAYLEAAHVTGREHDRPKGNGRTRYVHPDSVVPLCGPFPMGCHGMQHRHEFDLLPLLTLREQLRAVEDCGGIELARRRLCPSEFASERRAG